MASAAGKGHRAIKRASTTRSLVTCESIFMTTGAVEFLEKPVTGRIMEHIVFAAQRRRVKDVGALLVEFLETAPGGT
jgi:hypothetical protein